jgi:iron-sulfur cluster assembly accessory protein
MDSQISASSSAAPQGLTATPFSVTDSAAKRIAKITVGEPEGSKFRISIKGGGCSGFSYLFDFDATPPADSDTVIEKNGAFVVIDDMSLGMLAGSELDYVETLGSAGFEIKNPNATASCGCGNSFSV